jgi:LuxR family maltose regulon positive regulatory protein
MISGRPLAPSVSTYPTTDAPQLFVLGLDDYYAIHTNLIYDALAFLIDYVPPQIHLLLASRADPPLPIARPHGWGQLTGLYRADQPFSAEEAAESLNRVIGSARRPWRLDGPVAE